MSFALDRKCYVRNRTVTKFCDIWNARLECQDGNLDHGQRKRLKMIGFRIPKDFWRGFKSIGAEMSTIAIEL